jgi:outer membrane protein assembly factor BamB
MTLHLGMRRSAVLALVLSSLVGGSLAADSWPHWRGPTMNGISTEKALPTTWSATENVAWKLPLPAYSGSTPIIWNDLVFLNVATERATGQVELWTVDRNTKAVAWKRQLAGENRTGRKQNMASPSPVTDGTHVWAMTGTGIMKAFDFAGKEIWTRDLP